MRLHQLNQSHYPAEMASDILLAIQPLDAVLLIEAAALRVTKHTDALLEELHSLGAPVYILQDDKQAYGITDKQAASHKVDCISHHEWVELTCQYDSQVAW